VPQIKAYKKGSIIYFDGESKSNFVYLLKSGSCLRNKFSLDTCTEERSPLIVGEFFGIKAALGVPIRDETISVENDTTVYIFTPAEFDAVIKKNISIIFKMLKAFSNELRKIHKAIENQMVSDSKDALVNNDDKLFNIGAYYLTRKKYSQALHAYQRYIEHYPNGAKAGEAKDTLERIRDIMSGAVQEDTENSTETADAAPEITANSFLLLENALSYEPEQITDPLTKQFSIVADHYGKMNFSEAFTAFKELESQTEGKVLTGIIAEKTALMKVRLLFYTGNHPESVNEAKAFIKKFSKSVFVNQVMTVIAQVYLSAGKKDNAAAVYKKILDSEKKDQALLDAVKEKMNELKG